MFGGTEFFRRGAYISNYGFQNGTDEDTFVLNDAYGNTGVLVSQGPAHTFSGVYSPSSGISVAFSRTYSLVPGLNVLRIITTFVNNGIDLTLSYFDTFDPDQGVDLGAGYHTYNDVFSLAGGTVGQARIDDSGNQHTVIVGSVDPRATVASGGPFSIDNGSILNDFFASPIDGNDAFEDEGTHIGLRTPLNAGDSTTFVIDIAFGVTPSDAQNHFVLANSPMSVVPEPSSLCLAGMAGLSLGGYYLRQRRRKVLAS